MTSAEYLRVLILAARDPQSAPDIDDVCGLLDVPQWSELPADAPPIFRAIAALPTFRSQYRRNGLDGYVWNLRAEIPSVAAAFAAIGATDTATLLAELLSDLLETEASEEPDDLAARSAVTAFLAARAAHGGAAFGSSLNVDPIEEVHEALLRYLDEHADEVVSYRVSP